MSGLLHDEVDEHARIHEMIVENEIIGIFDIRKIDVRSPIHHISSMPKLALVRTMKPKSSDSPTAQTNRGPPFASPLFFGRRQVNQRRFVLTS